MTEAPHENHAHPHESSPGGAGGGQECVLCPICVLLQALSSTRPEVTEHLVAAGREFTRALRCALDGHAERSRRTEEGLQRIRVD